MRLPWLLADAEALGRALDAERLGHAPLLHGPAGIGKSELAHWLVARVLCVAGGEQRPCGVCRSCLLLKAGTHPDLFVARLPEDKTQITVDMIRELCGGLQLTPSIGSHRVGLIEPAERMNSNAANALLKTLEEPSSRAWLILVSDQPDLLPATVRSRCQKLALRPPDRDQALRWLMAESPSLDVVQLELALDLCGDAPLKALELARGDGLSFGLEVRQVLLDLAAGRPVPAATIETWSGRSRESWDWIAHWIRYWLGRAMGMAAVAGDAELPGHPEAAALARAWQRALEGRKLGDTSIRSDLLFSKWLLEWQGLFSVGR